MAKTKEIIPDLKIEELKAGHTYRSKKPKLVGIFEPLVDDRQIVYISQFKCLIQTIDHGFTPEFEEWCKEKTFPSRFVSSELDQIEYEDKANKPCRNLEQVWDHVVQYDSPTVKRNSNYPKMSATKFIKWAATNVSEIMPKGEWAKSF